MNPFRSIFDVSSNSLPGNRKKFQGFHSSFVKEEAQDRLEMGVFMNLEQGDLQSLTKMVFYEPFGFREDAQGFHGHPHINAAKKAPK